MEKSKIKSLNHTHKSILFLLIYNVVLISAVHTHIFFFKIFASIMVSLRILNVVLCAIWVACFPFYM